MDKLHSMLRNTKASRKRKPDHLTIFREFLSHLDKASRGAPEQASRLKPLRRKARTRSV
jgi:nitrate reductase assembly molybdenum cofactor insertion protein NarJ